MIEIELRMFGMFRKYERESAPMSFQVAEPAPVANIKLAFGKRLQELFPDFDQNGEQLINASVIASERQVLSPDEVLRSSCKLSILPPVCGG